MLDVQQGLEELDRWRDIPDEDDRGHRQVYQVLLELKVLSRIANEQTEGMLEEVVALLQHRGLTKRKAVTALDDVFFGIGPDWGSKWAELFRSYRK